MGQWMYRSKFSWPRHCWRWVVSFTLLPLYLPRKSPLYSLNRRLGGPQKRSGLHGKVKILEPNKTRTLDQAITYWHRPRGVSCRISTCRFEILFLLFVVHKHWSDRLCGLVVRVLGYRSGGPGSIPGSTKKKEWAWNGVHSASWVQLRSYLIEK
jgi:hypothetical protein